MNQKEIQTLEKQGNTTLLLNRLNEIARIINKFKSQIAGMTGEEYINISKDQKMYKHIFGHVRSKIIHFYAEQKEIAKFLQTYGIISSEVDYLSIGNLDISYFKDKGESLYKVI